MDESLPERVISASASDTVVSSIGTRGGGGPMANSVAYK